MYCAKCGREVPEKTVFCKACLDVMKQYPVKPGTSIQLPQRAPSSPKKAAPRKKQLPIEDQVRHQRKALRWLTVALVCTLLLLGLSLSQLFHLLSEDEATVTIGQNYMTREAVPEE